MVPTPFDALKLKENSWKIISHARCQRQAAEDGNETIYFLAWRVVLAGNAGNFAEMNTIAMTYLLTDIWKKSLGRTWYR
jgi:hypothetical protein